MAGLSINRLTQANCYINGANFLGRAEEITLPDMKMKMSEHKSLGMVGTFELFSGFEKMEMTIKWNSFYADALKVAADATKPAEVQIRGYLEEYTNGGRTGEKAAVVYITGAFKNIPMGGFKQNDNVELSSMMTVWAAKLEIDGEDIWEVDYMSNIYRVAGEDKLANYRQIIGA